MLAIGNSTLSNPVTNFKSSQPPSITPQAPVNFVELHNPFGMPCMRSRAQRRAAENQAMKMTRVGGPNLHRPQMNRAELVKRIQRQRDTNSALSVRNTSPATASALCEEFAQAYNYDVLTATASGLFDQIAAGVRSLSEYLPNLHIGPPMAEAVSVRAGIKKSKQADVGSFVTSFEKDFDVRMSSGLTSSASLKGVTVIIGEHHYDVAIQKDIVSVIQRMQTKNGDFLLMEGDDLVCQYRTKIYKIPSGNCISIDNNFPAYTSFINLQNLYKDELWLAVNLIKSKIGNDQNTQLDTVSDDAKSLSSFVTKYGNLLPSKDILEVNKILARVKQIDLKIIDAVKNGEPEREKNIMRKIKFHHNSQATNFAIMGAKHLFNLAHDLMQGEGGRAILMLPKAVSKNFPNLRLPLGTHDEL